MLGEHGMIAGRRGGERWRIPVDENDRAGVRGGGAGGIGFPVKLQAEALRQALDHLFLPGETVSGTCEKIGFTDFSTMRFQ